MTVKMSKNLKERSTKWR